MFCVSEVLYIFANKKAVHLKATLKKIELGKTKQDGVILPILHSVVCYF